MMNLFPISRKTLAKTLKKKVSFYKYSLAIVLISSFVNSFGQGTAGTNSWIGHLYDGTSFDTYVGDFTEPETFNENFGGDAVYFNVTSSSGITPIYTEAFSVAFKMNSSKKGLYIVNLGSNDGSRLTVDGTLLYDNWSDHVFSNKSKILMDLNGNSLLNYEFYENVGSNQIAFQNLTLILANTLSTYTTQTICVGSSGSAISGDVYETLPSGISKSGTGYQWSYSTTTGGVRTNISGATGATFTPNTATAPFNTAGTYYVYRNAILTSTNNTGFASFVASNESNPATITIKSSPSAPTVTTPVIYCQNATSTALTAIGSNLDWGSVSGSGGGSSNLTNLTWVSNPYSNKKTDFTTTAPNVEIITVNYTLPANQTISGLRLALYNSSGTVIAISSTTTTQTAGSSAITISNVFNYTLASAGNYSIGIYAGTGTIGGDSPMFPITESTGTINITGSEMPGGAALPSHCFNNIQFTVDNGSTAPTPSTLTFGTKNYAVTQTVNGCTSPQATISVIVNEAPSATISYSGTPYCSSAGTASITMTGTTGGTFSSDAGLSINASTGSVNLSASSAGTHTVKYSIAASGGCSAFSTTTTITITTQPYAEGFYPANPYCSNIGTLIPTGSARGLMGTLSATPAGLSINSSNGVINVNSSTPGSYTVFYNVPAYKGCSAYSASAPLTISTAPSATISYANAPFCNSSSSTESVTLTGTNGGVFSAAGLTINSSTGGIVPSSNSVGLYTINYSIAASEGCAAFSTSTKIYIGALGTWSGKVNTDWNNTGNWICGVIPSSATDATIPKMVSNFPNVISNSAEAKNLYIKSGASLIITGAIKIAGAINNNGNFNVSNGTLEMNGSDAQSIAGSMFENKTIKNLVVSNTGSGLSVSSIPDDTLKITGLLSFGNANSILNTGDNITLVSNYSGTASVGIVGSSNAINGKVIVERYINTGTAPGQHGKSWQFLSTPTNGQTVKESWMEGGNTPDNYGTMISGPAGTAAGFDIYSGAPSMKYYNYLTNSYVGISNTNIPIANPHGYLVFVRGDRTVTAANQPATTTVLRTKGTLFTGALPSIDVTSNNYQSIGNPYASPIDFSLINKDANVDDQFYVWDSYLYGTYGVGGYQTISSANGWVPVPGGTLAYPSGVPNSIIQSGQAFFVHSTVTSGPSPTPTISFTEDCKAVSSPSVNVSRVAQNLSLNNNSYLRVNLFTGPGQNDIIADGNSVVFNKTFSDNVDGHDALKILNSGENFGVKRAGKVLAIEAKAPLTSADTIFYNMSNLAKRTYQLRFAPVNLQSTGLQAFLIDNFLKKETPVSLSDSSFVDVSVTSNTASSAANRFMMVFRQMASLPVTVTSVTAIAKNSGNQIEWKVENENGIQQYEVEKSTDGNHFSQMTVVNAKNTETGNYNSTDVNVVSGINYYRIKVINVDGKISYTQVVKVVNGKIPSSISVYPNPIKEGTIHLQLNNQPSGIYKIKLYNSVGQVLISKNIVHPGGNSEESINCVNLPKGIYQLKVLTSTDNEQIIKVIN